MPLDSAACLRLLELLSADDKVYATMSHSVRNGLIVGTCATAGSIIMGPAGVAIGMIWLNYK